MSLKLNRRSFLYLGFGTLASIGAIQAKTEFKRQTILALDDPNRNFVTAGFASLKERANAKGLIYGAAIRHDHLLEDRELANYVAQECGMLTPEWALKWSTPNKPLRPKPDIFDFTAADSMLNYAQAHGLLLRGHTLVWHESLPRWFKEVVNKKNAPQFLEQHIKKVVGRYGGKIHSWDVVNEAIDIKDGRDDGFRHSPWLELLGPDYISQAFKLAAEADPQAMLVYNDYGLDYSLDKNEAKRAAVLKLLEKLKSKDIPIHALGIQAHLNGSETNFNPKKLREFLNNVSQLGLKILITELDVTDKDLPLDIRLRDRIIAKAYEDYLSVVLDEKAVIAVLTWGLSDRYTWLSEFQPRDDGNLVRPLLLDSQMHRKLAWNAMARAFDNAPLRS
jgi:endo-1,4-beta-xylanase